MNWITLLFWLFILSDGTGAAVGARSAWMRKLKSTGKRPEFATAFGIGFAIYAGVQYLVVFNNFASSRDISSLPPGYLCRAILLRVVQSAAIWLISLTLMGRSPLTSLQEAFWFLWLKFWKKGDRTMQDDKNRADEVDVDKKDPQAPGSPAPQTDDGDDDDKDKKPGEPIGPGE